MLFLRRGTRWLLAIVSLPLLPLWAEAQTLPLGVTQFGIEEGLSSDVVTSLLIGSRGFLWIGTVDGLTRYDGTEFRIYRSDPADSLSLFHNWVTGLSEDRAGRIWVTTYYGGLCSLDVYSNKFHCVSVSPEGERGLSTNEVYYAVEDRFTDELLWLATDSGLASYNVATSTLDRFGLVRPDGTAVGCRPGQSQGCHYARDIFQDRTGMIWTGDYGVGVGRFDPTRKIFRSFPEVLDRRRTTANPTVISVYEAPSRPGLLWVGVRGGLRTLESESGHVKYINLPDAESRAWVLDSFEDSRGRMWFATDDGLLTLTEDGTSLRTAVDVGENVGLRAIVEDGSGQLWLGSWGGGLIRLDVDQVESVDSHSTDGVVRAFLELSDGNVLVGAAGAVLAVDPTGTEIMRLRVPGLTPYQLALDPDGQVWIMTANSGLLRLDLDPPIDELLSRRGNREGALQVRSYDPPACARLAAPDQRVVAHEHAVEASDGRPAGWMTHILAADWSDDRSTYGGDRVAPKFSFWWAQHVLMDPIDSDGIWFSRRRHGVQRIGRRSLERVIWDRRGIRRLQTNDVWQSHATAAGDLLLATRTGLSRFVRKDSTFEQVSLGALEVRSPINVFRVVSDPVRPSVVWMATSEGLAVKDLDTGTVRSFSQVNSKLESRTIHDLAFDNDGRLWLVSRYNFASPGVDIARFDPQTDSVMRLRIKQAIEPLFVDSRGHVYLGGEAGWFTVDPRRIVPDKTPARLVVFEPQVGSGENDGSAVWSGRRITLEAGQRDLRIEYVAIHFRDPEGVRFSTFLEGYDDGWRAAGTERTVRLTNLGPGDYRFRLRAVTADGVWTEPGISVPIVVMPPWWRTSAAYALYLALVVGVLAIGERLRHASVVRRERHQSSIRESQIRSEVLEQKATQAVEHAEHLEQLEQAKSRFFANISHEFRTPITLVLGSIQDLLDGVHGRLSEQVRGQLAVVRRSGDRLLTLITQLLYLTKMDAGKLDVRLTDVDLIAHLEALVQSFMPAAERGRVTIEFLRDMDRLDLRSDPDMLDKVVGNLLSNALKFTPEGGRVWVIANRPGGGPARFVEVMVKDTGPGIPKKDLAHIFDRFASFDPGSGDGSSWVREYQGIGIGLALAKELVEMHKGIILVESVPGLGSTFTVRLPFEPVTSEAIGAEEPTPAHTTELAVTTDGQETNQPEKAMVLVVEDNADVRAYIRTHLGAQYRVLEAANGKEGLEAARRETPDLVLTDVMMPVMDGYELCRALKEDKRLRSVPVVMLTAKAGEESTLEGLDSGADDYIEKPFSVPEMRARVANLIEARRTLRTQFSREVVVQPAGITIEADDEAFLRSVLEVVNSHLGNSQFGVERLAEDLAMSSRNLRRRLEAVAGEAPGELIRRMRLERASQLLQGRAGTVSEVAYRVGFKSVSHFSTVFKEQYGSSPSEWASQED